MTERPARLADRLAKLRGQSPPTGGRDPSGLAERLARLRPCVPVARRAPTDDLALAAALGGCCLAPGLIEIERSIDLDRFVAPCELVTELPETWASEKRDWAFLDTETTGLAGGVGTVVFLIGLAHWRDGLLAVRQLLMTGFCGEAVMLEMANAWVREVGIVSYNGKRFDVPLLSTRARLAGVASVWQDCQHLDLLYDVRRAFASRWSDCRLSTLERRLLRVQRDQDLPGFEVPAAWMDYLRRGDRSRLAAVVAHNRQDLASLARALITLSAVYRDPSAYGADAFRIASAWLQQGAQEHALSVLESARDLLCPTGLHLLARLRRRIGQGREACAIWQELAGVDDQEAIARLSKYYEHDRHDLTAAHYWANRLLPDEASRRRVQRLQRKLARLQQAGLPGGPAAGP